MNTVHKVRIATDVGGTFTDLVACEIDPETGESVFRTAKASTSPPQYEQGVLAAVEESGIDLNRVSYFCHGTTLVINALLSRRGAKVGLITTRGFRDILEIARCSRPDIFNFRYRKPPPFVPRHLRQEITERLNYLGQETRPVALEELPPILDHFRSEGVQAVAISFLHAYANPDHELLVAARVAELCPDLPIVCSHKLSREWREYERTTTTVLSAYVQPILESYFDRLEGRLQEKGLKSRVYVTQSNGGVDTLKSARAKPIAMVESGFASGVFGAAALGEIIGESNVIVLDIGGTSAKCSLIKNGQVRIKTEFRVEESETYSGYPLQVPVVDIVEIGQGGGSIAHIGEGGKLKVGPESAGALPGPAAYNQGGEDPTTTDANLVLGRIDPDYFLGGKIRADMDAVSRAMSKLGAILGMSEIEVARGIVRIANNNMVNALKLVSVNRGFDPRDFNLVAFGGGGPMHATFLARELRIPKVIVPANSAVFSAWGMLMTKVRRDYLLTRLVPLDSENASTISAIYEELEEKAKADLMEDGFDESAITFARFADVRYQGQEHNVKIELPRAAYSPKLAQELLAHFNNEYEREYAYRLDSPCNIVNAHVAATVQTELPSLQRLKRKGRSAEDAVRGVRQVDFDEFGMHDVDVYERDLLEPGMQLSGPAIIEEPSTTVVLLPDQKVEVDDYGNLHITIG